MTRWLLLRYRKQNLLITPHISLIQNIFLFSSASWHRSTSRLVFQSFDLSSCSSSLWSPVWAILVCTLFITDVPVRLHYLPQNPQQLCPNNHKEKAILVYSKRLVSACLCLSQFSFGLIICTRDSKEYLTVTAGQRTAAPQYAWACCVHGGVGCRVRVRGKRSRQHIVLGWNQHKQVDVHKLRSCECKICVWWINTEYNNDS